MINRADVVALNSVSRVIYLVPNYNIESVKEEKGMTKGNNIPGRWHVVIAK